MARKRIYADRAEQMRAYRQRLKETLPEPVPATVVPPPKRPRSRPARLQVLAEAVQALHADYEAWLDNLPETLTDSPTGQRLAETVEQLEQASDILASIDPPKGYGRD